MTALNHILIAIAYTVLAAGIAIYSPRGFPEIGTQGGAVLGGVVLLASALLHEVFSRQESQSRVVDEVRNLRLENDDLRDSLDDAWSNVSAIREALTSYKAETEAEGLHKTRKVDSVIAEVKVLQGLIEQFATAKTSKPQLPAIAATAPTIPDANKPAKGHDTHQVTRVENKNVPAVHEQQSYSDGDRMLPIATGLDDEAILSIVRDGLEKNCVDLVLQPIVRLPQRKRSYFEAFTRIRDQNGSVLVPSQYIAIAEREGLVAAIDNMLLFRCVQLVRRTQKKNANIGVFCNISAHSLTDRHFFSNFIEFMADNTALAADLIFEFPYATIVNRDEEIEQHLHQLASLGFRFSVDQVSSLNIDYDDLMRHRFKFVKIDADIILSEVRNPSGNIAIEDIKRVVDRHGMDLIVEKIEREPDLLELLDLRVDFGQGYLFGAPRLTRIE
jgi:cyclic-di-GMP phosphodiesterase TipF (flagellum assembly factor)